MDIDALAKLARRVARKVRVAVPRSANRQLNAAGTASEWLTGTIPSHVKLLHTLVRTASKPSDAPPEDGSANSLGGAVSGLRKGKTGKGFLCFPGKVRYSDIDVQKLKRLILKFIELEGVDLTYRTPDAERAYALEFGGKLATFLNNRGYRKIVTAKGKTKQVEWEGGTVLDNLCTALAEHQRLFKHAINPMRFGRTDIALTLPLKYVAANARNALKFRVGNCEEVASIAFTMLMLGTDAEGAAIDTGGNEYPLELAYIKSPEGAAHFFVVINRVNFATEAIDADKDGWIADADTIICDPWITDDGLGGRVTRNVAAMNELRGWIQESRICVRATGQLGQGIPDLKDPTKFYI